MTLKDIGTGKIKILTMNHCYTLWGGNKLHHIMGRLSHTDEWAFGLDLGSGLGSGFQTSFQVPRVRLNITPARWVSGRNRSAFIHFSEWPSSQTQTVRRWVTQRQTSAKKRKLADASYACHQSIVLKVICLFEYGLEFKRTPSAPISRFLYPLGAVPEGRQDTVCCSLRWLRGSLMANLLCLKGAGL
jgi:hypothetical protein